ncbi:MAG: fumarate hydratase [Lentisphaerae bacterium]|nr:fumarate hydratase [Lentisphaerota bacterium]
MSHWEKNLFALIRRTSTDLPADVEQALRRALREEEQDSHAAWALETILDSVRLAREKDIPLCEDTGTLIFYYSVPVGFDTNALAARTQSVVARATRLGYLRQNTLDAVSGAPFVTNVAQSSPVMHFQQGARKTVDVRLVMKSAASENEGRQYVLPDMELEADRSLGGVRRCILDALWRAQGNASGPGVIGVCVGGDRATGYAQSKLQYLRRVGARSPVKALARLEDQVLKDARKLGIGPLGLGGRSTLLGACVDALSRLPSSYFVTVSFMGWMFRRRGALLGPEGGVDRWLY